MLGLESQLNHFIIDASSHEELKNITTIAELCQCLVDTGRHMTHNLIDRLLRLLLTLPVSTASVERVFSTLKIIKTILRNLGLVYFHHKTQFFKDSSSHRIFRRMHEVLNIDENKN